MPEFRPVPDSARLSSAAAVLAFVRRLRRAETRYRLGRVRALRAAALSPFRTAIDALQDVRAFGRVTSRDAGISRPRQFAYLWWLALRHGYGAETVYRFRLFESRLVRPVPRYLHWEHAALLYRVVAQCTARDAALTVGDKRRFAVWCHDNGFRTPPLLVEFESGVIRHHALTPGSEPRCDLFAKWATQYGGDDTARWTFRDECYVDDEGRPWRFEELLRLLADRSRRGVLILQPRLVNHPVLRLLSPSALSTIRVMTIRAPDGPPSLLAAVLRMATGRAAVDNVTQGGLVSAVDTETGVTGPGRRYDELHRTFEFDVHPDTGAAIAGLNIPFWPETRELTLAAHDRLGGIACIGWDVAILEDGPVLVEGNWNPGTKFVQVATRTPLLTSAFGETFAAWLASPACDVSDRWLAEHRDWSPV